MKPIIMIPSYNPDAKMLAAVEGLRGAGFSQFVLVDDGSRPDCEPFFEAARALGCDVVRHAVNLGKGRALKTGFNHVLSAYPDAPGVVSVDADGQHPPDAALRVAESMRRHPGALVLGVRRFFKGQNVPARNLAGNTITRVAFKLLTGIWYRDTQCGLRGFPRNVMEAFLPVQGDRFDYENVMLLKVRDLRIPVVEVPMDAVYIGKNESSHFKPMLDSVRIYSHLLKYASVPLAMALVSLLLFREVRALPPCWWRAPLSAWAAAACGLTTLAGWLVMLLWIPDRRFWAGLGAGILTAAVHATLFYALTVWAGLRPMGAWWLAGLPAAALSYPLWLRVRHGKKPGKTFEE